MSRKNNKGLRTCLYTNKQYERQELIRLVKVNYKLVIDHNHNLPGRGYWLKITDQALNDPKLTHILSKKTKCSVSLEIIKELKDEKESK